MKRVKHSEAIARIDGASRGNPGPSSLGVVFEDPHGKLIKTISERIGIATNNVAEYYALIFALQEALIMGIGTLQIFTDSELLARQFSGEYKIKDPNLRMLFLLISHLRGAFKELSVTHVPREQNKLADAAANRALDEGSLF